MIDDLISVIIPVYNVEKYLKECLDSVINQTHKNIEIILIDDGSTDNSGKICDEYRKKDDRIIVIHKSNEGLSSARNDGLIHAKGKYIQFIDSDDYVNRDMLEITYSIIKKYNADVVTFSHYILNDGKAICDCSKEEKVLNKMEAMKELLLDNKIRNYSWEKLWKKELFQDIKEKNLKILQQLLFYLKRLIKLYYMTIHNIIIDKDKEVFYIFLLKN